MFVTCLLACTSICLAQSKLKLTLHNIPTKGVEGSKTHEIVLGKFYGESFQVIATEVLARDTVATVEFTIPSNSATGLYHLFIADPSVQEVNRAEFIWNPTENLTMDAQFFQLKDGSVGIEASIENDAYSRLVAIKGEYDLFLDELFQRRFSLSIFDKLYKQKSIDIELQTERIQLNYDNVLTKLAELFPTTYTANTLIPLVLIPVRSVKDEWVNDYDSYIGFLSDHYFYHANFSNSDVLNHYFFIDKVYFYLSNYNERSTEGSEHGIDVIMSKLTENQEVASVVYNSLLKTFINLDSEHLTNYVVEKHSSECALDLPFEELKKLQAIQSLSIGGIAPEISLPDDDGKYHSLRETCRKNKLTVVFVWLSWCERCQKELPLVNAMYARYKSKGLGVFTVSLDEKKEDWLKAQSELNKNWTNVAEIVPIEKSSIIGSYNISTTPAIYLLDASGKVVAKGIYNEKLEQFIQNTLK